MADFVARGDGERAALAASFKPSYAKFAAVDLQRRPRVRQAIAALQNEFAKGLLVTKEMVIYELWKIVAADPSELMEITKRCCRSCWGIDFRRQHTEQEQKERLMRFYRDIPRAGADVWTAQGTFDEEGGVGYVQAREPNPRCPHCSGNGFTDVIVRPTSQLSPNARALYAGVKVNKDGSVEVKTHDKLAALAQVGRYLGMGIDKGDAPPIPGAGGIQVNINLVKASPNGGPEGVLVNITPADQEPL